MVDNTFFSQEKYTVLDGGMGTMLQAAGITGGLAPELAAITAPQVVENIHSQYIRAGANIICANTFGANARKLEGSGHTVAQVVQASVAAAKSAAANTSALVALDVGPLGELLEPGGTLSFEEAYELFKEIVSAGAKAGADLVFIETMTDLYEAKAALLAAKENTDLPAIVSMTFEENGRTFAGTPIEAMALVLAPLGAAALGINCSLGPTEILPLAKKLCNSTNLPVFVKPNAGLPNPATGEYSIGPLEFCHQIQPYLDLGVSMLGGCCGTTPENIAHIAHLLRGKKPAQRTWAAKSQICSGSSVLTIENGVYPIGERINPTGKKKLKEALRSGDLGYICTLAVAQQQDGAAVLDVNVGAPEVDETVMLPRVVKTVQSVSNLPLQLDSSNVAALEAALRVYNGKAIVNSTSGEQDKMTAVLPLCKKYGAAVVGLTLDEEGIPPTAEGRFAIAEKILAAALQAGIPKEDVYIDCLVLAASAEPMAAAETLRAVRMVNEELGLKTVLGVSNVSFGLPQRPLINRTFLAMALQAGLKFPIMNPSSAEMQECVAAFKLLMGQDENASEFVQKYANTAAEQAPSAQNTQGIAMDVAIEQGLKTEAASAAKALVEKGEAGLDIINRFLMPALDKVGQGFEKGTVFLPQLLAAAGAAGAAFDVIKTFYSSAAQDGPPVVLATVKGD
ncbi:MAG: homocysteine S-methyltransferase family protein, partial [Oscillospiraceae bacterium]